MCVWDLQGEGTVTAEWKRPRTGSPCARDILQGTGLVTATLDRTLKRGILAPQTSPVFPRWRTIRCRHQNAMHDIQT